MGSGRFGGQSLFSWLLFSRFRFVNEIENAMRQLIFVVLIGLVIPFFGCEYESENECDERWYQAWDTDDNQYIEEDEFLKGMMDAGYFFYWDGNASKSIEPFEFDLHHLQTYGSFKDFDTNEDGFITEQESLLSLFRLWDKDENEYLVCSEFDTQYLESFSGEFEPQEK